MVLEVLASMKLQLTLLSLLLLGISGTISASTDFQAIRSNMHVARERGDWKAFQTGAARLVSFLNGSSDALVDLARGQVHTGDLQGALATLNTVAVMGQSPSVIKTLADFAPIRSSQTFAGILELMKSNVTPQTSGKLVAEISDTGLLPEDIDYDSARDRFYLTSVLEKRIVVMDRSGRLTPFAKSADSWPMLAIKLDRPRGIVWATESAIEGFSNVAKVDWGHSALLAYDYSSGRVLRRIPCPGNCNLGDMTLSPSGDILLSDSAGGRVYFYHPDRNVLERVDRGDFLSPQTPVFISATRVLVPDYVRGLGLLETQSGIVRWFGMDGKIALQGIDGMYSYGNQVIAVQNGTTPERIASFTLDPRLQEVSSCKVLERGIPDLDPTHGVIVGSHFYFIENAGWNSLDDTGTVQQGASLTASRVMVIRLAD